MGSKTNLIEKLEALAEFCFLGAILVLPFSKAILEIFLSVTFISWVVSKCLRGTLFCHNQFLFLILGLYIITSSVSAFDSGYPVIAARGVLKLLKYGLAMLVAIDLFRNLKKLKHLIFVGILCVLLVEIDSMAQLMIGRDLIVGMPLQFTDQQDRVTGPFSSYGLLAALFIAVLRIMVALVAVQTRMDGWKRLSLIILLLMGLYLLYKTHSRGAWLAAVGSWFAFAFMIRKKALIVTLIALLLIAPFVLPYNAIVHLDIERKEQSLIERYYLWDRAIQIIKAKPWFGCGINTYTRNYPRFDKTKSWRVPGYYAHNGYLQLAAETGLLSLCLFLLLLVTGFKSGFLALKKAGDYQKILIASLITGFIALLLQAIVDTTLHNLQSAILIWLFLGLLIAINAMAKAHT